jgi:predicted ribosomally synthesized peptide with nif11-like leader
MSLSNARAFNLRVEQSLELQAQLEQIRSPIDLMNLARAEGLELTGADLQEIAQTAYQTWVVTLALPMRSFFELAQQSEEINRELKQCQTPADAIDLATRNGFNLTSIDFQQAATAAAAITGFSFEKLWFRNLGLL